MKLNNCFALSVSIAIAASLTATMTEVRAEGETKISPTQMNKVNVNASLTRTKLKSMSADSVLKLNKEGKIKLTNTEITELNGLMGKGKRIDPGKISVSTVMCPW